MGPDESKTPSEMMVEVPPKSGGNRTNLSLGLSFLDLRKNPHISAIYRTYSLRDFAD
jgi:hypothetical protein